MRLTDWAQGAKKSQKTAFGKVLVFRNWQKLPGYGQRGMLEEGLNQKRYL